MARFKLKTKNHGTIDFWCPDGGGYVRIETGDKIGTLGRQICNGGNFLGRSVEADKFSLETICRKWWRDRLRILREERKD